MVGVNCVGALTPLPGVPNVYQISNQEYQIEL